MADSGFPIGDDASNSRQLDHLMRNTLAKVCALLEMEALHASGAAQSRLQVSLARVRSMAIAHNLTQQYPGRPVNVCVLARSVIDGVASIYPPRGNMLEVECPTSIPCAGRKIADLAQVITELGVHLLRCVVAGKASSSPRIMLREEDGELVITARGADCRPRGSCHKLHPLCRELLVGTTRHALAGRIIIQETAPFFAEIRVPLK